MYFVSDFIASVSLGVHSLILHLSALTLLAPSSYLKNCDSTKNVGRLLWHFHGIGFIKK